MDVLCKLLHDDGSLLPAGYTARRDDTEKMIVRNGSPGQVGATLDVYKIKIIYKIK